MLLLLCSHRVLLIIPASQQHNVLIYLAQSTLIIEQRQKQAAAADRRLRTQTPYAGNYSKGFKGTQTHVFVLTSSMMMTKQNFVCVCE